MAYLEIIALTLQGTISDPKFQTSLFFTNPQIFLHFQGEIHHYKLPRQQFPRKQHIFGKRDNYLLLGINFPRRKLIQASVSSNKSFKF